MTGDEHLGQVLFALRAVKSNLAQGPAKISKIAILSVKIRRETPALTNSRKTVLSSHTIVYSYDK